MPQRGSASIRAVGQLVGAGYMEDMNVSILKGLVATDIRAVSQRIRKSEQWPT